MYQLRLDYKDWQMEKQKGPFWPMCYECMLVTPWEEVITNSVKLYEEQRLADLAEEEMNICRVCQRCKRIKD